MRVISILFLILSTSVALAGKPPPPAPNVAAAGAISGAKAQAGAAAGAIAANKTVINVNPGASTRDLPLNRLSASGGRGGQGGQGGAATASTGDSHSDQQQQQKQANSQETNVGPEGNVNDTFEDYVSAAYAPSVQPTVPCMLPINGGLVLPAIGSLSAGSGTIDVECERREAVRIGLSSSDSRTRGMANQVMQKMLSKMLELEEPSQASVMRVPSKTVSSYDSLLGE